MQKNAGKLNDMYVDDDTLVTKKQNNVMNVDMCYKCCINEKKGIT